MINDFLSSAELRDLGLGACGDDVQISRRALILLPQFVEVDSHSRIDAFCVISGNPSGIVIGAHVHLSAYVSILGADRTTIDDFCAVGVRCSLFTSNDDFAGVGLTNPTVPKEFRNVIDGPIHVHRHSIVGTGSVVLPNVSIGRSAAVGALTLVKEDVEEFAVVAGNPMKRVGTRQTGHVDQETLFLRSRRQRGPL